MVRHDPASGTREVLVRAAQLVPQGAKEPLGIDDFAISDDGRKLLFFTNTRKVWRLQHAGRLLGVRSRHSNRCKKLGGKAPEASLMFAAFDPARDSGSLTSARTTFTSRTSPTEPSCR